MSSSQRLRALQRAGTPVLLPNPWDIGSARLFESLGFDALATTSSGFAASLGLRDGQVPRTQVLDHAAGVARAVAVPVTADLESGFGAGLGEVADTYAQAARSGLAGASIEDTADTPDDPIRGIEDATDRVAAAASAAHAVDPDFVLTARADNFFHGRTDLADTIRRLQAYQQAGADALYAPGLTDSDDIRLLIASVDLPVNVLARPHGPTVAQLARLGAARISVGGAFAYAAYAAAAEAAAELKDAGTHGYTARAAAGRRAIHGFAAR